jgi:hypothetical protein
MQNGECRKGSSTMDRSDQVPNAEENDPKQDGPALPEEQAEHLARRRFLKAAVATAGATAAVGATASVAAASGGNKAFAKSLLYSLSPNGGGGAPSTPKPTATKTNPTATATTTLPEVSCNTCVLGTTAPFPVLNNGSFNPNESLFVSFTVHNLPPGTYTIDVQSDNVGGDFTDSSTPFNLQGGGNNAFITRYAAGKAPDCATGQDTPAATGHAVSDVNPVTVTGTSDADVQLYVHIQGVNLTNDDTYTFTGTIKQGNTTICSKQMSSTAQKPITF